MYKEKLKTYLERCTIQYPKLLSNGFIMIGNYYHSDEVAMDHFNNVDELKRIIETHGFFEECYHIDTIIGQMSKIPIIFYGYDLNE